MKKQNFFRHGLVMALILSPAVIFTSCEKSTVESQTFNDVFSTEKIQSLNILIENTATLYELPGEFQQPAFSIPEGLKDIVIADLIASYEQNIKLSGSETDLLLKNDITTFLKVIDRMSGVPQQIKALNLDYSNLKSSSLNKYLLEKKQEPDQYYVDNYYQSVIELQTYMKDFVIKPLKNFNQLVEKTPALKSAQANPDPSLTYQLIVSNNNYDMWWTYEQIGKKIVKTKHKGAAGSFPVN